MKTISEIKYSEDIYCHPNMSLKQVAKLMRKYNRDKMPVVNIDGTRNVAGFITCQDICHRSLGRGLNPLELSAEDCMTTPAITAKENMLIQDCYNFMNQNSLEVLPVTNEYGEYTGIVSLKEIEEKQQFSHQSTYNQLQLQC